MQVIHTVSLALHRQSWGGRAEDHTVAVGQVIPAELQIQHTRQWADPGSRVDAALEFGFEVHASPDTWLIGGQRKAHFRAKVRIVPDPRCAGALTPPQEHETLRFPLLLVPQQKGHLLYPSVDISTSSGPHGAHQPGAEGRVELPPPSSEIDYRNQGETLLVVPDLRRTTVGIDLENAVSSVLQVESKSERNEDPG